MNLQSKFLNLILMLGLVSIFAAGCGDSRHDYYYSGSYTAADNGDLLFKFQQPLQAQVEDGQSMLPDGTESLRFDFFTSTSSSRESYLYTVTRPAAPEVLVEEVPSSVHSVVVTALDGANQPLAVAQTDFDVVVGDTIIITFPYWEYTGIFEASAANRGTEQNPLEFPGAESDYQLDAEVIGYSAYFYTTPVGVDVLDEVKFFAKEPVLGLSVDEDSGSLTFDPELYEGGSFSVMVTYTHTDGEYYEEQLIFFVAGVQYHFSASVLYHLNGDENEVPVSGETPIEPYWNDAGSAELWVGEENLDLSYILSYTVDGIPADMSGGTIVYSLDSDLDGVAVDSADGSLEFNVNELVSKELLDTNEYLNLSVLVTFTNEDGRVFTDTIDFLVDFSTPVGPL